MIPIKVRKVICSLTQTLAFMEVSFFFSLDVVEKGVVSVTLN